MANYMTFEEIYQAVMVAIADSQYSRQTEVEAIVNMVYNEVLHCDELYPLYWMMEVDDSKLSKVKATISGITAASPGVITATAHGFVSGDLVTFYGIVGMTELNFRTFVVVKVDANSFSLTDFSATAINTSSYTAWSSGGYAHHRGVSLTDCEKVLRANWHGYNKGMEFIGDEQLEAQSSWWDVSVSRPLKMMHKQVYAAAGTQLDYLLWFQAADAAYNLRLWYLRQPARLSGTSDVPMLPPQFHDAIVAGAITRLGENKVQVEAGVIWPAVYNAQIDSIKTFNRKWWQENKPFERSAHFLI